MLIPENLYRYSVLWKNAHIALWWLSVNNFKKKSIRHDLKLFFERLIHFNFKSAYRYFKFMTVTSKNNIEHYAASYYAHDFLKKKNIDNSLLIEPISLEFLEKYKKFDIKSEITTRKDQVLYNPKKGYEITKQIIQHNSKYDFIPLRGLSFEELINLYKSSKLYIDFGPFPGAERMPKEAVLYGCNIITGKHGASAYYNDVLIPEKWKFEDNQIDDISNAINDLINNYEERNREFLTYKQRVLDLENEFKTRLQKYFFIKE